MEDPPTIYIIWQPVIDLGMGQNILLPLATSPSHASGANTVKTLGLLQPHF